MIVGTLTEGTDFGVLSSPVTVDVISIADREVVSSVSEDHYKAVNDFKTMRVVSGVLPVSIFD